VISCTSISTILADETTHPIIGPSYLAINNILKGSEFSQEIIIENMDNIDHNINLNFTGEIESWVLFYKLSNRTLPITSIFVNKSSLVPVLFVVTVPLDAANKIYFGNISAVFEDSVTNETGVDVQLRGIAPVQIIVTGEQILNVSIISMSIRNVENGFNAKIKIDFQNTGNVMAKPLVEVTFNRVGSENGGDIKISSNDYNFQEMRPGETRTYEMEWDTGEAQLVQYGNYSAYFNITLEGTVVSEKTLYFEVYDKGSRLRDGRLDEMKLQGIPEKGKYAVIFTNFTNTGEIDINSQFNGSVYRDGKLILIFNSSSINVDTYEKATFESNIPIKEDGQYIVKGHVYYYDVKNVVNGETEGLEVAFSIGVTSLFGIDSLTLISIIIIIIALLLILFLIIRKRQSSKPKKSDNSIKTANKKMTESKKVTSSETSKNSIRIGRNKEKSPFKKFQEKTQKNNTTTKKSEK
jgi:preprotein translocase subunit YajC